MRLNRVIYFIFLFMSFVFVYFYGGKVPYMFFYLVIALPVVSVFYTVLLYFGFTCRGIIENNHVLKGTKTNYIFEIHNKSLLLYPYIKIEFLESAKLLSEDLRPRTFSLLPFGRKKLCFELDCKYRGVFDIGIKSVEFRDLLGIFSFKRKPKRYNNITVYPNIIILEYFSPVFTLLSESNLTSCNLDMEDTDVISEIRPYSYGDNPKKIHWKLTSKLSNLMVKKYQNNCSDSITIYIDIRKNSFSCIENIAVEDKIIEAAISIIYYCLSNRISTSIVYFDNNYTRIKADNISIFQEVYNIVSKLSFSGNTDINQVIETDLQSGPVPEAVIILTCNSVFNPHNLVLKRYLPERSINLVRISPDNLVYSGNSIFDSVSDLGVNVYSMGINDDIKEVLEKR